MNQDKDPIAEREAKIAAWQGNATSQTLDNWHDGPHPLAYVLDPCEIDEGVALMRSAPDGDAAAEIDRLRADNERLRGRDAEPFDWDAEQTVVEWVEENLPEREPRAGSKMVELHADEVVADRGEARRVAGWLKDIMADNARLQADLAAARADQAAMARRELGVFRKWLDLRGWHVDPAKGDGYAIMQQVDQRLAALPAQQQEPKPDAATRDGDEVLREWLDPDTEGRTISGWVAVMAKVMDELCRRALEAP